MHGGGGRGMIIMMDDGTDRKKEGEGKRTGKAKKIRTERKVS